MTKITDLTQLTAAAATDKFAVVDVSDTGQAASGSTKYIDANDLFGDTTPVTFDLTFNSANGVNFGNDTLNYYREATTWTPTLYGSTVAGSHTYTTQIGRYNRIGNMVFFGVWMRISSVDGLMTGELRISGLPFTTAGGVYWPLSISLFRDFNVTGTHAGADFVTAYPVPADTYIALRWEELDGGEGGLLNASTVGTTPDIAICGAYETSA